MTSVRVIRGGLWYYVDASNLAARTRYGYAPSRRNNSLGFRCARTRQQTIIRMLRGGRWGGGAAFCHAANRGCDDPGYHINDIGLRVIRRKT